MSNVPTRLRDLLTDAMATPQRLSHLLVKALGGSVLPEDHPLGLGHRYRTDYNHPLQEIIKSKDEVNEQDLHQLVKLSKDGFLANVDVSHFIPEEITVKHDDGWITVEGKHEERPDDHGTVSRHFVRKYRLSEGHDTDKVLSTISSDGVLTIRAPRLAMKGSGKECKVSVVQPGKRAKADGEQDEAIQRNDAKKVKQ
ncbi:heat shock protein 23-like [Ochlerotatus camptorhynchus]|uniref:heat shock protein 23-like n=1 Tax=Ochlerotatus camptorhynchus TaxID=644619 RepID=UPI0031E1EA00